MVWEAAVYKCIHRVFRIVYTRIQTYKISSYHDVNNIRSTFVPNEGTIPYSVVGVPESCCLCMYLTNVQNVWTFWTLNLRRKFPTFSIIIRTSLRYFVTVSVHLKYSYQFQSFYLCFCWQISFPHNESFNSIRWEYCWCCCF